MTTVKEVLIRAKEKILKPEQWTKHAAHRNEEGLSCSVEESCSHCMSGAVAASTHHASLRIEAVFALRKVIQKEARGRGVVNFNDDLKTTHGDVLAAFDKAISEAQ
jgi:hypothetical protein